MKCHSQIRRVSSSRDGIALIMVLIFIALLTILIVSFISFSRLNRLSSYSYSKSIQAQEIAQGGLEDILDDFHQEIVAGSTAYSSPNANNPATVYVPTINYTAQPARLGNPANSYGIDPIANLPSTLVRVSRADPNGSTALSPSPNAAYYTGGPLPLNRASLAPTTTASLDGRTISIARWNKVAMLPSGNTAFTAPDWVYVTRGGSRVCTAADLTPGPNSIYPNGDLTNLNPVVGRYAYTVYDEGATLDINAAGYISTAVNSYTTAQPSNIYTDPTTGVSQVIAGKSYSAYADMTQLPGLTGAQGTIDKLIEWRNASTLAASPTGVNFYQAVFTDAVNGFKAFSSSGNVSDSPLLGRQDLINYFAKIDPNGNSYSAALPYLGTFTRAATAPSWSPQTDSPNLPGYYTGHDPGSPFTGIASVNYHQNAESTTSGNSANPNRDIPNVRYTVADTVTHYADDGTPTNYNVNVGDPVVQHRFSLAKLSWLTYNGPNPAIKNAEKAIQDCFGLTWGTNPEGKACWLYTAYAPVTSGGASLSGIQTLDQVAAGSPTSNTPGLREPNFFEMLKAGILSGSLAQTPGPVVGTLSGFGSGVWINKAQQNVIDGVAGLDFDQYYRNLDAHVLQIGANLIDQADTDSYPTAIYLKMFVPLPGIPLLPEADLTTNMVYGDENLPSISAVYGFSVETPSKFLKMWLQPELWNPHQAPGTNVTLTHAPTNFRLHAYGKLYFTGVPQGQNAQVTSAALDYDSTADYTYNGTAGANSTYSGSQFGTIYFTDPGSGTAGSPFYNNPVRLDSLSPLSSLTYSYGTSTTPPLNVPSLSGDVQVSRVTEDTDGNQDEHFAAFFAGETPIDVTSAGNPADPSIPNWTTASELGVQTYPMNPLYLSIEYQDPNNPGNWLPYTFMSRIQEQSSFAQTYGLQPPGGPYTNYGSNNPTQGATFPFWALHHPDPRTDRFSCMEGAEGGNGDWPLDTSADPGSGTNPETGKPQSVPSGGSNIFPLRTYGFVYYPQLQFPKDMQHGNGAYGIGGSYEHYAFWSLNQTTGTTINAFYVDPDGVVRPGDGFRRSVGWLSSYSASNPTYSTTNSGDGCLFWDGNNSKTNPTSVLPTTLTGNPTGSAQARRPVVLNRPFRSVAEMGYAFRDLPFKTLDFFSTKSGDAALLDLFSVTDEPVVSAGEVNLSNAPTPIITSILAGTSKMEINNPAAANSSTGSTAGAPNFISPNEASATATAIVNYLNQNGPLINRADLVTKLSDTTFNTLIGFNSNYANKAYAEAPVRALSGVTSTRTWNLLIDIIAQSGVMVNKSAPSLNNFVVQGERRYWLHIAIDRYTGKILDQQLESVYE